MTPHLRARPCARALRRVGPCSTHRGIGKGAALAALLLLLSAAAERARAQDAGVDAATAGARTQDAGADTARQSDAAGAAPSSGAPAASPPAQQPADAPVYPPGYVPSEQSAQDLGDYPPPSMYAVPPLPSDTSSLEGEPGAREHDGFFLRFSVGPGAGRTQYKESLDGVRVSDVETAGLSGMLDLAVGGRVAGNFIVHGDLIYSRFGSSTRNVDGVKDASVSVSSTATLLGAGGSYYFMPFNVYISTTLGLAWLFERRAGDQLESGTGFHLSVGAGKEWWVGRSGTWGIGAALRGTFAWAPADIAGVESTLKAGNIAVVFSATYN